MLASASSGVLGELGVQPSTIGCAIAVEHPEREAQRPHVLAAQRFLVAEAEGLHASIVSGLMSNASTRHFG
jgi:hypothetical protein